MSENDRRGGPRKSSGRPAGGRSGGKPGGSKQGGSRGGNSRGRDGDSRGGDSRGRGGDSRGRGGDSRGGDSRGRGGDNRGGRGRDGDNRGGRGGRDSRGYEPREERPTHAGPKTWGGVARKGAAKIDEPVRPEDEQEFSPDEQRAYEQRVAKRAAEAARRDNLREQAKTAVERAEGVAPRKKRKPASVERTPLPYQVPHPTDPAVALTRALGDKDGRKALTKLERAADSFDGGRFEDARKSLKALADIAPDVAEVRELYGLTLYRMQKWQKAADQLEEFRAIARSTEQNPVLSDCYRALSRWDDADFFWQELKDHSPSGELVTEGRIVAAGALADQGREQDAVRLLEQGWKRPKRAKEHHLSRAYALADLYDQVGDRPRAAELFGWIASQDASFSDAVDRSV